MNKKMPVWQEDDDNILAQFPDSPAAELLKMRQEPDKTLSVKILNIPQQEQAGEPGFQWSFGATLFNRMAGAAVLILLIGLIGLWVYSLSNNNSQNIEPNNAEPVSTERPTSISIVQSETPEATATNPVAEEGCPISQPTFLDPANDTGLEIVDAGDYFINENETIWVRVPADGWETGGQKVFWDRPIEEPDLVINGRLLNQESSPPLETTLPCCISPGGIQGFGFYFPVPGCWEVTARAGEEQLQFVAEVNLSNGTAVTGLTLLGFEPINLSVRLGSTIALSLTWQSGGADARDMILFLDHYTSEGDLAGHYENNIPAASWTRQTITTTFAFTIHNLENIENHSWKLGLYDTETMKRVPFYYNEQLAFEGAIPVPIEITR